MKKNILNLLGLVLLMAGVSCKKTFLDERSESRLAPVNAFTTSRDFTASINNLYRLVRNELYTINDFQPWDYAYRTDIGFPITAIAPNLTAEYNAVNGFSNGHWSTYFKIIAESNTIIARVGSSSMSETEKRLVEAEARFFRGFAYRCLGYLFGGVPLITTEISTPKVDFVRATRKEVYAQVIEDFSFAAANLRSITAIPPTQDGRVSNLVAQHYLSEIYIADGQFQKAVDAATVVISNPNVGLMTSRFGSRRTVVPGDVYWDLFRMNNQNRAGGVNREALWVIQLEPDVPGGLSPTTVNFLNTNAFLFERVHSPLVRDLRINGAPPFEWPMSDYSGGRGVGFIAPSRYFIDSVYSADPANDIRNANHNFVRRFRANRIASPLFGQEIDFHNLPANTRGVNGAVVVSGVPDRALYPYQTKCTEPFNHPANLYAGNVPSYPLLLKSGAGATYQDQYLARLAETYLLRAEAYLGLSNTTLAANDINVVRARANAAPVAPANVNIDYILDERIREFGFEEKRMLTLMRMGKWYDRVRKCNPFYAAQAELKHNLWPIPQNEIDRNRGAVLTQNPGY